MYPYTLDFPEKQELKMCISLKDLPRFGNRRETARTPATKNNNTPGYSVRLRAHWNTHTHRHTSVQDRAIHISTHYRESAQGHIFHLYCGWQQCCAGVACSSPRDVVCTETVIRHRHKRGPSESSYTQLAFEQAEGDSFFFFPPLPEPAPLMRLLLLKLTTTAE